MNFPHIAVALSIAVLVAEPAMRAQARHPIPRLQQKDGRYALMVDGSPFLMLGAQTNNSSDWPSMLPAVWPSVEYLHANTLEIPIYWEQFEPQQGQFDYSQVDLVLSQARQHHVRLVLLWFGTWKNGSQHYMPEWMKLRPDLYGHDANENGELVDSPTPFDQASLNADIQAFSTLMRHLKGADAERTVLMVQVENETGSWGILRDHSSVANELFASPVPSEVLKAMNKPAASGANWETVFGSGEGDVYFNAWAIARYVGKIAAAGKAIYPLPLYVNVAIRDPEKSGAPGTYESGGPTDNVIPIWKAEAPAIDLIGPDIYLRDRASYLKALQLYHRPDNALFVPETSGTRQLARFLFSAIELQAIGYSPFGLDLTRGSIGFGIGDAAAHIDATQTDKDKESRYAFLEPTAQNYRLLGPMMADIARLNFEGRLHAVAEAEGKSTDILHFAGWDAIVSYGGGRGRPATGNPEPIGRALVAQLNDNQFLVTGYDAHVDFRTAATEEQRNANQVVVGTGQTPSVEIDGKWKHRQFLRVEQGIYENGRFRFLRNLNGDQTDWGLAFQAEPEVLRVSLASY